VARGGPCGAAVMSRAAGLRPGSGWTCDAFPETGNNVHLMTLVVINVLVMWPVDTLLARPYHPFICPLFGPRQHRTSLEDEFGWGFSM